MKHYIEAIKKIIESRNLVPKLCSILLAVILWAYISSSKSGDVKFKIPVAFTGLQENYIVSKISSKVVTVEIYGDRDELKNVSSKNIKLAVDLSGAEPGVQKYYPVQYQKIDLNDDFKIDLSPEELKIQIEKKAVRNVKIIPRYKGYTEKGFMVGKIRCNPEYVRITGPGSVINNIGAVYTDFIPVDEKNSPFHQDIRIEKVNEEGVEYSTGKVNVSVPVMNFSGTVSYEIPVLIRNRKKGFNYTINSDRVKINVMLTENKNITDRSFSAYIDADEIEIDNDELARNGKIEITGYIHADGDTPETDSIVLSANPDRLEIVVTKE